MSKTGKRKRPASDFYVLCPCGNPFPRGVFEDYDIECPECGKVVHVPKFQKPVPPEEPATVGRTARCVEAAESLYKGVANTED